MFRLSLVMLARVLLVSGVVGTAGTALASFDDLKVEPEMLDATVYSPYVNRDYPDQVLFGDAHFHTNLSPDAGLVGTTLDVDAAYRFARGEKVISNTGQPVQLVRPLDFLFITDHAEFLGLPLLIRRADPALLADPWGRKEKAVLYLAMYLAVLLLGPGRFISAPRRAGRSPLAGGVAPPRRSS